MAGLRQAGLDASQALLEELQAACEGLDHSASSGSRHTYVGWTRDTLSRVGQARASIAAELAPRVVPALEQLHQAPMVPLPDAAACLRKLKDAGFVIAACSNWGWDLRDDLGPTRLTEEVDIMVTSAQVGSVSHTRGYISSPSAWPASLPRRQCSSATAHVPMS
jgi:hypothetical protein